VVTDNSNRTVSEMRHLFSRNNGNMGQSGSVGWMFHRKGNMIIPKAGAGISEDDLLTLILEAGAEDMQTDEETYVITTTPNAFETVKKAVEDKGIKIESAALQMIPQNTVKVTGKEAEQVLKLMEVLEEHDDVQNVYSNFDIDEKELAALQG
jgi:YebC/PmpR family DNA-binding regulatory protein